jgi:hypothetical protein
MTMPNDPIFKPGDEVKDFRGRPATVRAYRIVHHEGKSNRVEVDWDNEEPGHDKTEYYAGVFSPR